MPQLQVVDLNPRPAPKREPTALDNIVGSFLDARDERQDLNALTDIYRQNEEDGNSIEKLYKNIQTDPRLSPTTRTNAMKQALEFGKFQQEKKKQIEADLKSENQRLKESEKKRNEAQIIKDREKELRLDEGALSHYEGNIAKLPKQPKANQADRPIDPDQLRRIQQVEETKAFTNASVPEKQRLLRNKGVSKENIKSVTDAYLEENKPEAKRQEVLAAEQAKADIAFAQEIADNSQKIFKQQETLNEAERLNNEGVTGNNWDIAMQKAGLVQFTSDGYRLFSSLGKDAVKNQNIKATIGSQISQMEFGFFRDATINPNFRKEANDLIIKKEKLATRYEKLYEDIANKIVEENGGELPVQFKQKVNKDFEKQAEKISKEVSRVAQDFEAIQNVPKGKVLMFDENRRPLHVPENEVEKYSKLGASLS